jgi:hypothetical protein
LGDFFSFFGQIFFKKQGIFNKIFFSQNIFYKMAKNHQQKNHQLNLLKTGHPRKMYQVLKEENDQNSLKEHITNCCP